MQDMLLALRLGMMTMIVVGGSLLSRILVREFLNEGVFGLALIYLACWMIRKEWKRED
jgi:uncharacterized membrane protein YfcA